MKRLLAALAFLVAIPLAARADVGALSSDQIDDLDRKGYLTASFKSAARELIDAKQAQRDAVTQQAKLEGSIADLQAKAVGEEDKVAALKKELAQYDHPDETDFAALGNAMKDASAKPEDKRVLAQAYIWTYPTSPHQTEAQADLAQVQKELADQVQSQKDADAAKEAAQIKLLARVKSHDLSLEEWRAFLLDKTQNEVSTYLGQPTSTDADDWIYSGAWTVDPATKQKAGLEITFNGGRVQNVTPVPGK